MPVDLVDPERQHGSAACCRPFDPLDALAKLFDDQVGGRRLHAQLDMHKGSKQGHWIASLARRCCPASRAREPIP
jgi:hypothetical protein